MASLPRSSRSPSGCPGRAGRSARCWRPSGEPRRVYRQIQKAARTAGADTGRPVPTAEYLTRHALESFLDRLTKTPYADQFVLKGGILFAAYGARRPTRDVDSEAIGATVSAENLAETTSTSLDSRTSTTSKRTCFWSQLKRSRTTGA
ncbi:nucleotidyl transferase AbiEii/AbiGii toxin family protein [uncultured Nocardioides sp.]|uniref:nucleotidyl transferase AbiEii/AbiGii toxin family protein n=1 Tax=uncultured Nocardioides sp. TaxID=198441 RepID=UPI00344F2C82